MLVERLCPRYYAYTQQEIYLRNQRIFQLQRVMEELKPFPLQKNWGYTNGFRANEFHGDQLTQIERYTFASSLSSKPTVNKNQRYFPGGNTFRGSRQSKSVCPSFTKLNPEVTAFGPRHAEHVRRFYHSEEKKPELRHAMVSAYRPNYGPMEASYYRQSELNNGSNLLGDSVFNRGVNNSTTWCTKSAMGGISSPMISRPSETVLKVARISPRPDRKQPKTSSRVGVTIVNKTIDGLQRKSNDFLDSKLEMDLKDAPLFQILCEISKT